MTPHSRQPLGDFEDPYLTEAVRITSMRLRVKAYSASRIRKYAHLPTIHIEGEMASNFPDPSRKVEGTVCIIGDGSVRWTLVSTSCVLCYQKLMLYLLACEPAGCADNRLRLRGHSIGRRCFCHGRTWHVDWRAASRYGSPR